MDNLQSDLTGRSPERPVIFPDVLLYRCLLVTGRIVL
jgi:hypothetical protein